MFTNKPRNRTQVELSLPDECPECQYRSFDINISYTTDGNDDNTHRKVHNMRKTVVKCSACLHEIERIKKDCRSD